MKSLRIVAGALVVLAGLLLLLLWPRGSGAPADLSITIGALPETNAEERMVIQGTRTPGAQVEIRVNGKLQAAGNPEGSVYYATVKLDMGQNVVEATAIKDGKRVSETYSLFRGGVSFTDMNQHWARPHAELLASLGVVNGMGDGTFAPDQRVTRAQFAKMAVVALNLPIPQSTSLTFQDARSVPDWAQPYVAGAAQAGLIKGYDDNTFRPDQPITRAQIAAVVARALWVKGHQPAGQVRPFVDQDFIPTWVVRDVEKAAMAGIITGYEDGTFRAERTASRAEAATMVRRLWDVTR